MSSLDCLTRMSWRSVEVNCMTSNLVDNNLDLENIFPFPLDEFQIQAIKALDQGHSVVVSAPTGSGKTLIGEYAILSLIHI